MKPEMQIFPASAPSHRMSEPYPRLTVCPARPQIARRRRRERRIESPSRRASDDRARDDDGDRARDDDGDDAKNADGAPNRIA